MTEAFALSVLIQHLAQRLVAPGVLDLRKLRWFERFSRGPRSQMLDRLYELIHSAVSAEGLLLVRSNDPEPDAGSPADPLSAAPTPARIPDRDGQASAVDANLSVASTFLSHRLARLAPGAVRPDEVSVASRIAAVQRFGETRRNSRSLARCHDGPADVSAIVYGERSNSRPPARKGGGDDREIARADSPSASSSAPGSSVTVMTALAEPNGRRGPSAMSASGLVWNEAEPRTAATGAVSTAPIMTSPADAPTPAPMLRLHQQTGAGDRTRRVAAPFASSSTAAPRFLPIARSHRPATVHAGVSNDELLVSAAALQPAGAVSWKREKARTAGEAGNAAKVILSGESSEAAPAASRSTISRSEQNKRAHIEHVSGVSMFASAAAPLTRVLGKSSTQHLSDEPVSTRLLLRKSRPAVSLFQSAEPARSVTSAAPRVNAPAQAARQSAPTRSTWVPANIDVEYLDWIAGEVGARLARRLEIDRERVRGGSRS